MGQQPKSLKERRKMSKEKSEEGNWEELGTQQIHLDEEGDTVIGTLLSVEKSILDVNVYHIKEEGGGKEVILLGSTGLDKKMAEVEVDTRIKIVLNAVVPTRSGFKFKDYRVFV